MNSMTDCDNGCGCNFLSKDAFWVAENRPICSVACLAQFVEGHPQLAEQGVAVPSHRIDEVQKSPVVWPCELTVLPENFFRRQLAA
jgi:hypothetical protein